MFSGIGTAIFVGLFSWYYTNFSRSGNRNQRGQYRDSPEKETAVNALAECGFWKGYVNVPGAPTQNELLLLLQCRFPKWTSKRYLKRSMRCITQSLDDSIDELTQSGRLKQCCGNYLKLGESGLKIAQERATEYAKK